MAAEFANLITSPESDGSAVDAIVSQAIDLSVLEQIVELNSSNISLSSSLPANLETRFRKLQSFPLVDDNTTNNNPNPQQQQQLRTPRPGRSFSVDAQPGEPMSSDQEEISSPGEPNRRNNLDPELSDGLSSSPSPPRIRMTCCFGCSSEKASKKKKTTKKKKKTKYGDRGAKEDLELDGRVWGKNDEILSDFSTFSLREQQRKLKTALREEEKASREAAKVVEWVKQASARIDASTIDGLLSEDEK